MAYIPRHQFMRQQASLSAQAYAKRPPHHRLWPIYNEYMPADAARLRGIEPWMQQTPAGVQINVHGMRPELLAGIRCYGAMAKWMQPLQPSIIGPAAAGAVIYDTARDRMYYATSSSVGPRVIHPTLLLRVQHLPFNARLGVPSLVNNHAPVTCSEFKALNRALLDGAIEADLEVWTFTVKDMRPKPQCKNCRVTVPQHALARVWTG